MTSKHQPVTAPRTTNTRRVPVWLQLLYIPVVIALSLSYFWGLKTSASHMITFSWLAIGCLGMFTMLAGVLYYHPAKAWPWWFFIAANACFIGGDTYYNFLVYIKASATPYPSFGDVMYQATFLLYATGMYLLIRQRSPKRTSKSSLLDATTIAVSLALVLWVYLVLPIIHGEGSGWARAVSVSYPLGDTLIWALLIRLLFDDFRTRAVQLLALGAFGLIASDIIYAVSQLYGTWSNSLTDIGWILFYTTWGAAALNPSMLKLSQPLSDEAIRVRSRRLIILSLAALVAPLILIIKAWQHQAAEFAGTVAGFAAVLFVLVMLRLYTLVREVGHQDAELRLSREKSELLAISGHQLRTPLTTIKVYAEMLSSAKVQADPQQVAKYINTVKEANDYMIGIVESIIYTAQLDMGDVRFRREQALIAPLIDKSIRDALALADDTQGKAPVRIVNKLPGSLAASTDPQALGTIFTGILTNAMQYRADIDPKVTISATTDAVAKVVTIHITDNGKGIPTADQPKIFTKLYRGSNARTISPDGSGLSLYMARSALGYLGGTIDLESTEGAGTTVHVSLPIA